MNDHMDKDNDDISMDLSHLVAKLSDDSGAMSQMGNVMDKNLGRI